VPNTFGGLTLDLSCSCNINGCKCRGGENDDTVSADLLKTPLCSTSAYTVI